MPTKKQKVAVVNPNGDATIETTSATSPVITKSEVLMDFYSALRLMEQGYKIRRASWPTPDDYCVMHDGKAHVNRPDDGKLHPWIVSDGDLAGADWETV